MAEIFHGSYVYVDVRLRGSEREDEVRGVLIDSGLSYTVMPRDVLEDVVLGSFPMRWI
jgi:predicted aspartyl protease